jgi:regulator of replication initiation timing
MNFIQRLWQWRQSKASLLKEVGDLRLENEQLRKKVAALQKAKDEADQNLQERRREKEVLRSRITAQKKTVGLAEQEAKQLSAKLTQLREENERLENLRRHKKG